MGRNATVLLAFALGLLWPVDGWAQQVPLSELLVRLSATPLGVAADADDHSTHFRNDLDQASIASFVLTQQLVSQLTTGPIASPAGGFAYRFDATTGVFTRTSGSFGPAFAERALTNGRGKLTMGVNVQRSNYTSYGGQDLRYGDIKFYVRHRPVTGDPSEGDLLETSASVNASTTTTTTFGNFGVTDRWDVAVAVPFVRVDIDAALTGTILRLSTGQDSGVHRFVRTGTDTQSVSSSGSASGLGDILIRSKYRLVSGLGGGVAAALDVNLPSGDERNLLGASAIRTTFTAIASSSHGRFSPHLNVSYTKSGGGEDSPFGDALPDEAGYRIGAEYALTPTVTLSGTVVGRSQLGAGRLDLVDVPWAYTDPRGIPSSTVLREYQFRTGTLNVASLAMGAKANLTRTLVLSGNLLVALTSAGVTARITPVVAFDYTF
jgi:hypothetical protein